MYKNKCLVILNLLLITLRQDDRVLMPFIIFYILSILLTNCMYSLFPSLDIVWSTWSGLIFILRDMIQQKFGPIAILITLIGLILSYITSNHLIALASAVSFAASESTDWIVFTFAKRDLHTRLWISSAVSIPVDTFIFFSMINLFERNLIITSLVSKFVGVSFIYLMMVMRTYSKKTIP